MFGFSFPSHWQWISTDLSKKSGMFGDLGSRSTTTWELLIEELPLMLTAAVTSGLPHPPSCHSAEGKTIITLVITRGTTRLKYLRALDKIYGRRTMSVLVKAKHWDDSLKACDEHLVPGFQALVTNCWRLPSTAGAAAAATAGAAGAATAGAAGAPFCYFQASPNGSHQLCTSYASLLHLFLGMALWTVIRD